MNKMEEWRDVKGYEGLYQISNLGRVKSLGKEKILTIKKRGKYYFGVGLYKEGKQKNFLIHRLVAETFIPNPDNLPQVNHKDENKENNSVDNLEWCDAKYNNNYGTKRQRLSNTFINYPKYSKKSYMC